jgi:Raf kinase inhibitor-like YbhB/YbcL family protein
MSIAWLIVALLFSQEPKLTVTSPDFENEGEIPSRFTCDGEDINPAFEIGDMPAGTKSIVVFMEDPDRRSASMNFWTLWNLKPTGVIEEGTTSGVRGSNSMGKSAYLGPCPAAGTHRYFFKVFALNDMLNLPEDADRWAVQEAMKGHVLASGEMMGWYRKK